jgi:hypothetical protein
LSSWFASANPETLRAVGSYPTFSPLPAKALLKDDRQVSLPPVTEACFRGGLFSVALSVTRPLRRTFVRYYGSVPWRYQARCPFVFARAAAKRPTDADRCPDFPPVPINPGPAIIQLTRQFHYTARTVRIFRLVALHQAPYNPAHERSRSQRLPGQRNG